MRKKEGTVYILASRRNGTLYVGVTSNLPRRLGQHLAGEGSTFVRTYKVHRLVYYESFGSMREAIAFEKRLKRWRRPWKLALIESTNPAWRDLSLDWD